MKKRPNAMRATSGPAVATQLAVESLVKEIRDMGTPEEQEQKIGHRSQVTGYREKQEQSRTTEAPADTVMMVRCNLGRCDQG